MKKKIPNVLFSGFLLLTFLVLSGCSHSTNGLAFEQDRKVYVIDKESATVTVYTQEGEISQLIGIPGAGTATEAKSLPPAILHYLLLSKGSISGLVWNDVNGNRLLDAGENGVKDVRIFIDNDNSSTYTSGDPFELTDANGS